ncbi:TIGR03620 family F420-dependent LLM class oxidoreductase [Streptomyces polygonati]|uniref:TIGR03620 family F420-dependent LLM class oxidoreductase n=1 Tax=Streptomyces polygonati TaxID=1617087 RepID=A0ABV8HVE1_9ACTN
MAAGRTVGSFGIFSPELRAEDPGLRAGLREAAAELEELGFGALWLGGSSGVRHAARLAGATSRIVLATGIANIWFETAAELAAARARLEEAHPGRFLLGLGASHAELVARYERPYTAMARYLDGLDTAAVPVPADRRVLAALGPKMLRLARDRAAGALPYLVNPEYVARARSVLGDGPLLAPEVSVVLESRPDRAREIARGFLPHYLQLPNFQANLRRLGFTDADFADHGSDRMVDSLVVWGPDEVVRDRLAEYLTAGADHLALQIRQERGVRTAPRQEWRRLAGILEPAQ